MKWPRAPSLAAKRFCSSLELLELLSLGLTPLFFFFFFFFAWKLLVSLASNRGIPIFDKLAFECLMFYRGITCLK